MRRAAFLGASIAALALVGAAGAGTPRLSPKDRAQVNHALDVFVNHAVKRHNPGAAYDVVTPTLKGGMTRAKWAKGDIGVYPYPAAGHRFHKWTIQYRTKDELSVELILAPTARHRAKLGQILFNVYLHPSHGRWLVDSFMPGATFAPIGKPGVVQAARDFTANPSAQTYNRGGKSQAPIGAARISAKWAVVPFAVILFILLALAARGIVENLRFRRLAAAHRVRPLSMRSDEPSARPRERP
jgi:hypothetical protein